jgi:hypothetical protein
LTPADFDGSGWQDLVANSVKKDCFSYSSLFLKRLGELGDAGDATLRGVFTVLYVVTSVALRENDDEPFAPRFVRRASRGATPDDLTSDQFAILETIAPDIVDAEMRARVCDLVWVMRRNHRLAKLGVEAYLATARVWEDWENWVQCAERLTRAVRLARSLGGGGVDEFARAIAHAEDLVGRMNGEDPLFLSARLMELLLEFRKGDPVRFAAFAEKAAARAEGGNAFERANIYWQLAANWHGLAGDGEAHERARMAGAESHVKWAEVAAARPRENMPNSTAASYLQMAHHAFLKIGTPGARLRAEQVYRRLVEVQKKSVSELIPFRETLDLTDAAKAAQECVAGRSLTDALIGLVRLAKPTPKQCLREQVSDVVDDPLLAFFSRVTVGTSGKIEATTAHFDSSPDGVERTTIAEMHRHAVSGYGIVANGAIFPAVVKIRQEHRVREQDIFRIVSSSYFVPRGRAMTFTKGLYAGFAGDLIVATHLLIPQIEESIRTHLELRGAITSGFDRARQRQNEYDLNTTLYMPELRAVFDEDTIFALQGLLVEHFGANLRNLMAHGLLSDEELQCEQALYLWALTLRLCMTVRHPQEPSTGPADEPSTVEGSAPPT